MGFGESPRLCQGCGGAGPLGAEPVSVSMTSPLFNKVP